jgi:hypothetical protein
MEGEERAAHGQDDWQVRADEFAQASALPAEVSH